MRVQVVPHNVDQPTLVVEVIFCVILKVKSGTYKGAGSYGYGGTVEVARARARAIFKDTFGRNHRDANEEITIKTPLFEVEGQADEEREDV